MDKLRALWGLFRKGEALENPGAWKNATIISSLLSAVVYFLKVFGIINLHIDDETLGKISVGGIALVNVIMHTVTSKTVGLPRRTLPVHSSSDSGTGSMQEPAKERLNPDDLL